MRVLTFDRLYAEVLDAAGEIYVELSEPVQYQVGASNLGGRLAPVYNVEWRMANVIKVTASSRQV